jgi:hypothetical protein
MGDLLFGDAIGDFAVEAAGGANDGYSGISIECEYNTAGGNL